jgi:hypothetical protein
MSTLAKFGMSKEYQGVFGVKRVSPPLRYAERSKRG